MAKSSKEKRHLAIAPSLALPSPEWPEVPVGGSELSVGERLLQVGELAKVTGKTVRAIHFYEDMGLIRPVERSKGRYRLFSPDTVVRVRWIAKLQRIGFSLPEIQRLAREQEESNSAMFAATRLRDIYIERLAETRARLAELQALEAELEASLKFLHSCDSSCQSELPTTSCPTCDRHAETKKAPELVAGLRLR